MEQEPKTFRWWSPSRSSKFGFRFHSPGLWGKRVLFRGVPTQFFSFVYKSRLLQHFCTCPTIQQMYHFATPRLRWCNNTIVKIISMFFSFHWTKSFEPEPTCFGCWSRSQELQMSGTGTWAGARNLSSGSTALVPSSQTQLCHHNCLPVLLRHNRVCCNVWKQTKVSRSARFLADRELHVAQICRYRQKASDGAFFYQLVFIIIIFSRTDASCYGIYCASEEICHYESSFWNPRSFKADCS